VFPFSSSPPPPNLPCLLSPPRHTFPKIIFVNLFPIFATSYQIQNRWIKQHESEHELLWTGTVKGSFEGSFEYRYAVVDGDMNVVRWDALTVGGCTSCESS
jgi:hypothetical protein